MKLFKKFSEDKKGTVFELIIAAISLIPVYGDKIGNGLIIATSLRKLLVNTADGIKYDEIKILIDKIRVPDDLEDQDIVSISEALHTELEKDGFDLNIALCTPEQREKLKTEIFIASDKRREVSDSYKSYISQVVDTLGSNQIRSLLPQAGQVSIEIIAEIKNALTEIDVIERRLEEHDAQLADHETRIKQIETDCAAAANPPLREEHNEYYREIFTQQLFLEKKGDITLEKMYVSPMIKKAGYSAAEFIMNWYRDPNANPCLLLYGDAGVGKTSLVSKIVVDACKNPEDSLREYDLSADEVQTVMLRKCCALFQEWSDTPCNSDFSGLLKKLFSVDEIEKLKGKLLILDGLDELTVLVPGFQNKAVNFLENLGNLSVRKKLKILMTSRSGYFKLNNSTHIDEQQLVWEEAQIKEWCEKYAGLDENKKAWCESFQRYYQALPKDNENDKRYEVFCIPIILYLACNSGVELTTERELSVGEIYDDAFRKVTLREHIIYQEGGDRLRDDTADQKLRLDHWQYTKELAYQMFLQGTLDLVDSDNPDDSRPEAVGFRNAQKMTRTLRGDNDLELSTPKYLAFFPFSKTDGRGGISFVHKTVYEYFTAVKLYEDYFAKFNFAYFRQYPPTSSEAVTDVMTSFIEAFRYKPVMLNIFMCLNKMTKPVFTGTGADGEDGFRFDLFAKAFSEGMERHFLSDCSIPARENAYKSLRNENLSLNAEISLAFCNFTWFLTYRENGFRNAENSDACKQIADLITCRLQSPCLNGWDLSGANLDKADLRGADLRNTILNSALLSDADLAAVDLTGADLSNAILVRTNLRFAYMGNANLRGAILGNACLYGAWLTCADLREIIMHDEALLVPADLRAALYDQGTRFPDGFDPASYSMIEVKPVDAPVQK